jgi:hypothetical protein
MAPHYSSMSIGAYRRKLDEALAQLDSPSRCIFLESWHTQPEYLDALAANVRATLDALPRRNATQVLTVFTAHSLPESILARGEPYDRQLRETAKLLADRLQLPADRWTFSYQSAAKTGVPWLGPQIEDLLVDLAAQRGEKQPHHRAHRLHRRPRRGALRHRHRRAADCAGTRRARRTPADAQRQPGHGARSWRRWWRRHCSRQWNADDADRADWRGFAPR